MKKNYDSVVTHLPKSSTIFSKQEITSGVPKKRTWHSFLTMFIMLFSFVFAKAQSTLINPATDGGFENGSTFAANGWTAVNATTDTWNVGAAPVVATGSNCAFVSADNGVSWSYSQLSTFTHIYKDLTIPAGESKVTLSFKWKALGEGTTTSDWDNLKVFLAPTSYTPTSTTAVTGATQLSGAGAISGMYKLNSATWNSETITFLGTPGTTYRLIFSWKSDSSTIANPPTALDDISVVSNVPGNFISIATGNFNAPTTWDANAVPTIADNATISTGHTVTINALNLAVNNLIVDGTVDYTTTPTEFVVNGNLSVNTTGIMTIFNSTTGKILKVGGNITNNGRIDTNLGTLTLTGSSPQTIGGTGVFGGTVSATGTTNTVGVIASLICNNTSTTYPNINWQVNNIRIKTTLNLTGARIDLNANKLIFGNYSTGTTLTNPAETGLYNGIFARWFATNTTGTAVTAGSTPTTTTSRFPFIKSSGEARHLYVSRSSSTTTGNTAGELAAQYTEASTSTSGLTIDDAGYTITSRHDGNWSINTTGSTYVYASGTHTLTAVADNAMIVSNGNIRLLNATATIGGTHQNGNTNPTAQRIGLSTANITNGPIYIGINTADIPKIAIMSGDWNVATNWNDGIVPLCSDNVVIPVGITMNINSTGNFANTLTIQTNSTLNVTSGDLTIGCVANNHPFTNNGTLTVSGGTLSINGNMLHNTGSTFNQSAGEIIVDGSDGTTANSVLTGTNLVRIVAATPSNLNLTGGTLTIVDPSYGTSTSNYALQISQGGAANAASPNHTVKFGNGISTTDGGHANGFYMYLYAGSYYYSLGNVNVDALTGVNRYVKTLSNIGILNNLTITSGEYWVNSTNYIAGNIVNNGTLTATSLIAMGTWSNGVYTTSANAQSISGAGVFRNLQTAPTANLTNFQVANSNSTGVTLNTPLSVSGTLTLSLGFINTTSTNILKLGTATAAGTLSGGTTTAYIKGPFARTIASANATTNFIHYPVGKTGYNPLWIAPTTTAVTEINTETFDTNTGTTDASIIALASKRWQTSVSSGSFTDIKVRLGDSGVLATSIPVQAPTAAGVYTSIFGSIATAITGISTESNIAITSANYSGFLSFANSNACSGTPAPGNTVASSTSICFGESVTLSLQNITNGSGVTYQWKSSTDGTTYSNLAGATNPTLTLIPTEATYYLCDVTCSSGSVTGTSVAVQVTFTNNITATTPGTRCGTGTIDLVATPNTGASVNWYTAQSGGVLVGSGNNFTTPSISATTTFYAIAETTTTLNGLARIAPVAIAGTTPANYGLVFDANEAFSINSVDVFLNSTTSGNVTVVLQNSTGTTLQTITIAVPAGNATTPLQHTLNLNFNVPSGIGYRLLATTGVGMVRESALGGFPYNLGPVGAITSGYISGTTTTYYYFYNWSINTTCSSESVPVIATVTAPPALTLSTSTSTICESDSSSAVTLTSTASDYDTYVWSPSTGVSGNSTTGWIFNPTVSTTYTLNASQSTGSLCVSSTTVVVTVNPLPTVITFSPASSAVCVDTIQPLTAIGGTIGSNGSTAIGTATTLTTEVSIDPTAFNNRYEHYWLQMVFTQAELNAAGVQAGNINGIKFDINSIGSAAFVSDFKVNLGSTTLNTITGFTPTGLTQVFSAATYNQTIGSNSIVFNTPYSWDGTSNIIVDIRSTGADSANNSATYYTATPDNKTVSAVTSTTFTSSDAYVASNPTGTLSLKRLNTTFDWTSSLPTDVTWSPITNLYTDAAATVAYVANTNAPTVYFKSSTAAAATTYTATATSAFGCSRTATTDVTVNALTSNSTTITACDSYTWAENGMTYTASGTYTSVTGCNTETLNLTITTSSSLPNEVVSACDTYTWAANGTTYTTGGTYTSTTNCVTRTLNLTINASPSNATTQSGDTLSATETGATYQWLVCDGSFTPISGATSQSYLVTAIGSYAVDITKNGCTVRSACVNVTALGNATFDLTKLSYYPNPVLDMFTVRYSENITSIDVYDLSGRRVKNSTSNNTEVTLNMSDLAASVYVVKVFTEGKSSEFKIVKK